MKIYNYDQQGIFTNESNPRLDPIEKKPMVPGNATLVKPVKSEIGFVNVFSGVKWDLTKDDRGIVYDTSTQEQSIYELIGELPANLTKKVPLTDSTWNGIDWELDLDKKKETKRNEIRNSFANSFVPVAGLGFSWNPGIESSLRLDGAKRLVQLRDEASCTFFDINNISHVLTTAEAEQVVQAVGTDFEIKYTLKQNLMVEIESSTIDTIDDITW